jgi:hypothetical protein
VTLAAACAADCCTFAVGCPATGQPPEPPIVAAYVAARTAGAAAGPTDPDAPARERAWQAGWLAERLGLDGG